ncbi:hypothetical protein [Streptomyces beijiangensis]|uniref:Uncharacterized protein n=1 Tax=Streptomyces beijiangensis TaxID=163361 RepID=A0A939FDU3_9ACTN|nr:hypothetical protein [Streptomyces beijiangensis]MBO0516279.1 hypothetical protein [Streptomyces beijiangensis]
MNATTKTETTDTAAKAQAAEAEEAAAEATADDDEEDDEELDALLDAEEAAASTGVKSGAAAVVAAALGFISLSGSWLGTVTGAWETLSGQVKMSSSSPVATQIKEGYTDGWHATALIGGLFALLALIVAGAVLAAPAFGAPRKAQAAWIKSVSWAGLVLGVIGLLLAIAKYTDIILGTPGLPSA